MIPSQQIVLIAPRSCEELARRLYSAQSQLGIRVWWEAVDLSPDERLARFQSAPEEYPGRATSYRMTRFEALNRSIGLLIIAGAGLSELQLQTELAQVRLRSSFRVVVLLPNRRRIEEIPTWMQPASFLCAPRYSERLGRRLYQVLTAQESSEPHPSPGRVFLCHASEDADRVREVYRFLGSSGLDPWFDKERLTGGDNFEREIATAINSSDLFIAFLSSKSVSKQGFVQKELRMAVSRYQMQPYGMSYIVPVRLDECPVPPLPIDERTNLSDLHWLDVFESQPEELERLLLHLLRQLDRTRKPNSQLKLSG